VKTATTPARAEGDAAAVRVKAAAAGVRAAIKPITL